MNKRVKKDYEALAKRYDFYAQTLRQNDYEELRSFLPRQVHRTLDAGCGSGILTLQLTEHVNHVVGIDISHSMISLAMLRKNQLQRNNVDFVIADLENLPFREQTFDFITSRAVLHYTKMTSTLPNLSRLLRPRGRIAICDYVNGNPRLNQSFIWFLLHAIITALRYALSYNPLTSWRLIIFHLHPRWIKHLYYNKKLLRGTYQSIFRKYLPGCKFKIDPKSPWKIVVFWETPKPEK